MNEELKIIISAEIAKLKQGVDDAKKHISSFKEQVEKASSNVKDNFSKIGSAVSTGLKAVGTTIAAAGAALLGLGAASAEYRNEQAKLVTAFEAAGGSAETAKETYNDLYRVLGDGGQATEAAGHLAKLTTEEKALSEWTNICQGVYATFGESIPIESLAEGASEASRTGTITAGLTDALVWAGVAEDEFNEKLQACAPQQERESLIRETLNGLYSEAAATYEENNAQVLAQNEAQAKLQETTAKLGEAVAPVITAFTNFANDALAVVVPYIQQLGEDYGPKLQEVLEKVATALQDAFTWASEHKAILAVVGGLIAGVVTAIGLYNAVAAIKAAMDAAQVVTLGALIAAYAAQAAAMIVAIAPYLLIVAAIAAVIAIIVLCVKHWDEIKAKVKEVWDAMKKKISEAADNVKQKVSNMISNVKEKFEQMKQNISEKTEAIKSACREKFEQIKQNISEKVAAAKTAVVNKFNEIKSGITEKINSAKSSVSTVFSNIQSTISSKVQAAKTSVLNVFNSIKKGIQEKINAAKEAVSNAIEKIKGFMKFDWSLPKLKLPKISISGKFSLNPPSAPKFSINWNRLGGVFDNPAIFGYGNSLQGLGEDGAEAIVPLEKNTQWLDKIADKLAAKQGKTPIVLQVDGKTFAQTSIDSINQLTRQRGKLALNLI